MLRPGSGREFKPCGHSMLCPYDPNPMRPAIMGAMPPFRPGFS